ncbi:MAG: tetratricopeptide repeat protein [Chloroflexota bacterium]|nr:tetratricopeptide repeat protein [Chloroflexota bacterium]
MRPLYERACIITEAALGPTHPDTATSLNNLAGLFDAQGDLNAARPLLERAIAICEQSLGLSHPTTCRVRENLSVLNSRTTRRVGSRYSPAPKIQKGKWNLSK